MMNLAGFSKTKRNWYWSEAANCATDLDNLIVREGETKPPCKMFYGKDAGYATHLRTFGEIAITKIPGTNFD